MRLVTMQHGSALNVIHIQYFSYTEELVVMLIIQYTAVVVGLRIIWPQSSEQLQNHQVARF